MPPTSRAPSDAIDLGPLGKRIGYRLRRAHMAVRDQGDEAFGGLGLRAQQYGILLFLNHAPGHKQMEVGIALGIQRSNLVKMIDELEGLDLAQRSEAPDDARAYILQLTKKGKALLRRAKMLDAELDRRFDRKLGRGGRKKLLELLTKLAAPD